MAVLGVTQWRTRPGRAGQFIEACAQAKKIHLRLGARSVRLFQATFAGPNANLLSYVLEFDSSAAQGAFSDKLAADGEWQKLWQSAGADPSADVVSNSLSIEVSIG